MRRYASGDDSAFDSLYHGLAPRLYRFCLRLAASRNDADDFLQETFLRLHRSRSTYLAGANVLFWSFAIARSVALDRIRYRRRRPEDLGAANDVAEDATLRATDGDRPDVQLLTDDLRNVVSMELQKMSEKNRVAYVLLREEELSVKEAVAIVGTSENAVKQRAHRAYEQLRNAVSAAGWKGSHDEQEQSWNSARALRA